MAEDSEHDVLAIERLWSNLKLPNPLKIVGDGRECLDYLLGCGEYVNVPDRPTPGLLLLDINLPVVDGFKVLRQIKETPVLRRLPVVVFTSSSRVEDKLRAYDLGANAFLTKPVGAENLAHALKLIQAYWELMDLPNDC
jgi:two-component system response regulator